MSPLSKLQCKENLSLGLPKEIILKILTLLSFQDIVNLCISKVFFSTIISMPCVINDLIHFQNHCLCQTYIYENQLLLNYVFIPFIINNQFCFAIDKKKLYSFKILSNIKILNIFFLNIF